MADPTATDVERQANLASSQGLDFACQMAITLVNENLVGLGLSVTTLDNIKLMLACHFGELTQTGGAKMENRIGEVTERFHNVYDKGLYVTRWGQQAVMLDTTGKLAEIANNAVKPMLKARVSMISPPTISQDELDDTLP